jgi:histidinol-phosphatase (PHP family)
MLWKEFPRYLEMVQEAREAVPQLPIRLGLEVDYLPEQRDWIAELCQAAPWDYLIGSVHYLGDWALDSPFETERFAQRPIEQIWAEYWSLYTEAAGSGFFDIMAHPDLVKKFGHRPTGDLRRYYEPAIAALAEADVAIEINTAGLFKNAAEMYPAPTFLEMAYQAGIPLMLSSDAHDPAHVGRAFPQAAELAKNCGYTHLARFQGRQRSLWEIEPCHGIG